MPKAPFTKQTNNKSELTKINLQWSRTLIPPQHYTQRDFKLKTFNGMWMICNPRPRCLGEQTVANSLKWLWVLTHTKSPELITVTTFCSTSINVDNKNHPPTQPLLCPAADLPPPPLIPNWQFWLMHFNSTRWANGLGGCEGHVSSSMATIHVDLRPRKWRDPLRIVIMLFEFWWTKSFINCCLPTCGTYLGSWRVGVMRIKVFRAFEATNYGFFWIGLMDITFVVVVVVNGVWLPVFVNRWWWVIGDENEQYSFLVHWEWSEWKSFFLFFLWILVSGEGSRKQIV